MNYLNIIKEKKSGFIGYLRKWKVPLMKKPSILIVLACLVVITGLSGCTEQDSSTKTIAGETSTSSEILNQQQIQEPETLEAILNNSATIESIYYEITTDMSIPEIGKQTATIKIWQKKPYFKEEITSSAGGMSTSISVIQRPEGTFLYHTDLNQYLLTTEDISSVSASLQYFDNDMIMMYMEDDILSNFETEIIDGKQATIIQYSPMQDEGSINIKLWIWTEKGLPLKAQIDMTLEEISMDMEFRFSNYSFQEIPDGTFDIT
jgi:outer membrane lipoprotein-sorting protein